jgi:hypothetical protein
MIETKHAVGLDIELYRDYLLIMLKSERTGKVVRFETWPGGPVLDFEALAKLLRTFLIVTFNGDGYDRYILDGVSKGFTCEELKKLSDAIIEQRLNGFELRERFDIGRYPCDHIDVMPVAPGQVGLKQYAGRIHAKRMQELPFDPAASVEPAMREVLTGYCENDLDNTLGLFRAVRPQLLLRERMTDEYGRDLRSKSDAQIAEIVLIDKITELLGYRVPDAPKPHKGMTVRYKCPDIVSFRSQTLRDLVKRIEAEAFPVSHITGKVSLPKWLEATQIRIGKGVYRMGIGGLHSSEKSTAHIAGTEFLLIDRDVASYYPWIILVLGLFPKHIGEAFLTAYRDIVERRIAAKRAGDTVTADALKIVVNSSFGKFGSIWSRLFSPDLLIQTTITGQLALLMFIEWLEDAGIEVVSANTDGIVIKCPKKRKAELDALVRDWELFTGLDTEETQYSAIYSKDVNNYIAIKSKDGKAKLKGLYAPPGLAKNPTAVICTEAVVKYLTEQVPLSKTISECRDLSKFVTVRLVKGGAEKYPGSATVDDWVQVRPREWVREPLYRRFGDQVTPERRVSRPKPCLAPVGEPQYLGKVVRWYYGRGELTGIYYCENGNTVARSEGGMPVMNLPDEFPEDMDLDWYVTEANSILENIGYRSHH